MTIFGITGLKTFLDVLFSIQFTAHLDEAGDVCGVVAGVGVLLPVAGVHGLTAAPTLATAWLEAAGPATTRTGRGALGTAATSPTPAPQENGEIKSQFALNCPHLQCDFDFMYDEHFT